jgi:hypothetical protein
VIVGNRFFWKVTEPALGELSVSSQYEEVLEIIAETKILLKKSARGQFLNGTIPIKRRLDERFKAKGWQRENPRVPDPLAMSGYSNMDWQKGSVGVEIQVTANTSRMLNDFRRMEMACEKGLIRLGMELTLMLETAKMCTDRIASFEDGVKYVQRFEQARCVVIGLVQDGFGKKALPKQLTRQGRGESISQPDFDDY